MEFNSGVGPTCLWLQYFNISILRDVLSNAFLFPMDSLDKFWGPHFTSHIVQSGNVPIHLMQLTLIKRSGCCYKAILQETLIMNIIFSLLLVTIVGATCLGLPEEWQDAPKYSRPVKQEISKRAAHHGSWGWYPQQPFYPTRPPTNFQPQCQRCDCSNPNCFNICSKCEGTL